MQTAEVIEQIKALPTAGKLLLLESLAHALRTELEARLPRPSGSDLAAAAAVLREDYATDPELTAFTALDGEDLHATR